MLITNPANDLDNNRIVEIGAGKGELLFAIDYIYKCTRRVVVLPSYTIIDTPENNKTQQEYLGNFKLDLLVSYEYDYTDPRKCFVISTRTSAIDEYINKLILPHAYGGFFVWNNGASLNFLIDNDKFNTKIETENPQTGPDCKIVTFIRKSERDVSAKNKFYLRNLP